MYLATLAFVVLLVFGLSWGSATVLLTILRGPWRQAAQAHWTERARLGFAPGVGVLWLAMFLPVLFALFGEAAMGVLAPDAGQFRGSGFLFGGVSLIGVLRVRYRWLREFWGPRVTLRSWLSGLVVILFMLIPQFVVLFATLFLLPDSFGPGSWLVLAGAFATLAFLTWGGALRLWRLLRIARPAPVPVVEMVEGLAAEMKFTGNVRVVQLEWPQVNAVAWVLEETVGFSRAMLEVMDLAELRAIAAHEVAHLLESRGVKAVRVLHLFAYLPLAPLMKYGGSIGLLLGYVLMCGIFIGYKNFARRLENRADRIENETLGDPGVYMRSMIKLHESNLAPAVMPGRQTHPHLYDRLLAAGIQPEFPRPMAPNRTRPTLAALGTTVAAVLVFFLFVIMAGCNQRLAHEMGAPPATTNSVDTH